MQHLQKLNPGLLVRPHRQLPQHLREKQTHLMQRLQSAVTFFCSDHESKLRKSKNNIDSCIVLVCDAFKNTEYYVAPTALVCVVGIRVH